MLPGDAASMMENLASSLNSDYFKLSAKPT